MCFTAQQSFVPVKNCILTFFLVKKKIINVTVPKRKEKKNYKN